MMLRNLLAASALAGAFACGGPSSGELEAPDALDLAQTGGAVETNATTEFVVRRVRGGRSLSLYGDAARSLFGVLGEAGVRSRTTRGVEYRVGSFVGCASSAEGTYCQLVDTSAIASDEGFLVTLHGQRFVAGASELFGLLAAASGVAPTSARMVEHGRFVYDRESNAVWCGLRPPVEEREAELVVRLVGLEPIGPDYVYEGWLITADGPVASGRFDVASGDEEKSFTVSRSVADASTTFVLTVEPARGDDPAPAATHVVAGDFEGGLASLSVSHPAALGDDLSAVAGTFFLETPSSAAADDYELGIWFIDTTNGPAPGLVLPQLPEGWSYEGWVAGPAGAVSTGRFTSARGADSDRGGPTAGPLPTPPFPGQDFIDPPMDLVGLTAVISIEPEPDNSPAPFALKPLVAPIADRGAGGLQTMRNQSSSNNPRGFATLFDESGRPLR